MVKTKVTVTAAAADGVTGDYAAFPPLINAGVHSSFDEFTNNYT